MNYTKDDHKQLAGKALNQAASERGLAAVNDVKEVSKDEMPKRKPDYYVTLASGVKLGIWEEPVPMDA